MDKNNTKKHDKGMIKNCLYCRMEIPKEAEICRYCHLAQGRWHWLRHAPLAISFAMMFIAITQIMIGGYQLSLANKERADAQIALKEANQAKESVKQTANALLKISHIIADGSSRWGGLSQEHKNKIKEYQQDIKSYLDKDLEKIINKDIQELNNSIDERNKK